MEQFKIWECRLPGANGVGEFELNGAVIRIGGFPSGSDTVIRFMPDCPGLWHYRICTDTNEASGEFLCTPPERKNHGMVTAQNQTFRYADGSRYFPFGTTCYGWIHQNEEIRRQTLETLSRSPFNKLRMCLFPKYMVYNEGEPEQFPFQKRADGSWDVQSPNEAFWEMLEKALRDLDKLGIEADLILFHPYDHWGFATMSREDSLTYLCYCVRRLSPFKNIWWSLANEYDILPGKTEEDWEAFAACIRQEDPYGHLLSIHNCCQPYPDRDWMTHCSIQTNHCRQALTLGWEYKKPIVIDECGYEGNIEFTWGNLSGFELVNRFWTTLACGGYCTHGETFFRDDRILWWGKGGTLRGKSVSRIAFARNLLESLPGVPEAMMGTLSMDPNGGGADSSMAAFGEAMMRMPEAARTAYIAELIPMVFGNQDYRIYYLGRSCPAWLDVQCPRKGTYKVEIIDVWEMTRTPVGEVTETGRVTLPGKEGIAVLLTGRK